MDTNKHPLIDPNNVTFQAGTGIARPKNDNWFTVAYRYLFFFINAIFVAFGLFLVGFGLYGIARLAFDGVSNPIVITSDPTFTLLILGIVIVLISVNGALGFLRSNSLMLQFFAWLLVFLFFVLFVGSIAAWAFAKSLRRFFKFLFLSSVLNYDTEQRWALSKLVTYTQTKFQCCGSKNFTDWGRQDNHHFQTHCNLDKGVEIETSDDSVTVSTTGTTTTTTTENIFVRRRRQVRNPLEININIPQSTTKKPPSKYSNRKLPTSGFDIPPLNIFAKPARPRSPAELPPGEIERPEPIEIYEPTTIPPSYASSAPPPSRPPYELTAAPPPMVLTTQKSNTIRPKNLFNGEDFHDPEFVSNDVAEDAYDDYYESTILYTTTTTTTVMPETILGSFFEINGATCFKMPESCCLGGGFGLCGQNMQEKPHQDGCFDRVGKYLINSSAMWAGCWIILWFLMLLQIMAAKAQIRQIHRERVFLKEYKKAQEQQQKEFERQQKEETQQLSSYPKQEMLKLDSIKNPSIDEPIPLEIPEQQFPSMNDLSRLQSTQPVESEPAKEPPRPISISSGEESEVKVNVNINDMA